MFKRSKSRTGAILIVSLWILVILSILAIGIAHRMSIELKLVKFYKERLKARALAEAAVRKMISVLKEDKNDYDSLNESWSNNETSFKDVKFGDGSFTIGYASDDSGPVSPAYFYGAVDEERKINVNIVTSPSNQSANPLGRVLPYLLGNLGLGISSSEIAALSDCIKDWIDEDSDARDNGAENSYYTSEPNPPYKARDGKISNIYELRLVKGMKQEYFNKIKNYVTELGDGKINLNTVQKPVLSSLFMSLGCDDTYGSGFSDKLAGEIIEARSGRDRIAGTQDDMVFNELNSGEITKAILDANAITTQESAALGNLISSGLVGVKSSYFRIYSTGIANDGRIKQNIEAVLKRDSDGKVKTVFWHEN